jgi:hypothetical protein
LILESGGERREIKVSGPITIGRSKTASIHIDDKVLSREHTQVYLEGGRCFVKDLESKNGTFLNGALIKQPELLKNGDRIKVGPAFLTFVAEAGDAPPPAVIVPPPLPPIPRAAPPPPPPAPPAPARARPRSLGEMEAAAGTNPAIKFVFYLFLLLVLGAGTFVFKVLFTWALHRVPA